MAIIKITNFAGELPSVSPRTLPAAAAQIARNLLASTPEFRPLPSDVAVAVSTIINPKTLHRLARKADGSFSADMAVGWITSSQEVSYVKGQIDDDTTERTYYTFDDGLTPPRALDALGRDRKMGVPQPGNAPGTELAAGANAFDQYTGIRREIAAAVEASFVDSFQGNSVGTLAPSPSSVGWAPHGTGLPSANASQWNFMVPLLAGKMDARYTYLTRPEFGGQAVTYNGGTYFAVPIRLHAAVSTIDGTALRSRLTALQDPANPGDALLVPAAVTSIVATCDDYWSLTKPPQAGLLASALLATKRVGLVITQTTGAQIYSTQAYLDAYDKLVGTAAAPSGIATDRIIFQATKLATRADGTTVATPSRYRATSAAANIRADIALCIGQDAQGQKVFDEPRFVNLLNTDFESLLVQHTADRQATLRATLPEVINYCTEPLRQFFSFASLASLSGVTIAGTDNASALLAATAEADAALARLAQHYAGRRTQAPAVAENAYALAEPSMVTLVDSRFYICTQVSDWGEESAPSLVSALIEPDQRDAVRVTCPLVPTGRHIKALRIYRSNVGSQDAPFQLVAQLDDATQLYAAAYPDVQAAFTANNLGMTRQDFVETHFLKFGLTEQRTSPDDLAAAGSLVNDVYWTTTANRQYLDSKLAIGLGKVCPTLTWLEPPAGLRGLVGVPNGIMAGFVDNFVAFCDPYHPYAWPVEYQITTEHPIVGLGVFGQTIFVGTRGNPYFISGSDAASMSSLKLGSNQACVSRRSIAAMPEGVVYASPDGLCLASQSGVQCLTDGSVPGSTLFWTAQDWSEKVLGTNPQALHGVNYEGIYLFFWNNGVASGCYALGRGKLVRLDLAASALYVDLVTDTLYLTAGTAIQAAFSGTGLRTATWKTGLIVLSATVPFAWAQVDSDFEAPVTLRWTADGALRHTTTFTSRAPQRLPPGRWLEHEVEIESKARVTAVTMAGTTDELKAL